MRTLRSDTRGASSALGYVLNLGIMALVMTTVTFTGAAFMDQQSEVSTENRLGENGEQLTRTIQRVDRLVQQSGSSGEVGQALGLPPQAGGKYYRVHVFNQSASATECGGVASNPEVGCIILETTDDSDGGATSATVYYRSDTTVETNTIQGGSVYVVRPDGETGIEVRGNR